MKVSFFLTKLLLHFITIVRQELVFFFSELHGTNAGQRELGREKFTESASVLQTTVEVRTILITYPFRHLGLVYRSAQAFSC